MDDAVAASSAPSWQLPRLYAYTGAMIAVRICRRWQRDPLGGWWDGLSPGEQAFYIGIEQVWMAEEAAAMAGGAARG